VFSTWLPRAASAALFEGAVFPFSCYVYSVELVNRPGHSLSRHSIGIDMIPMGDMGLIFASVGLVD